MQARLLVLSGVIAAVALIALLWQPETATSESTGKEAQADEPGYAAQGAQFLQMGEDGQPLYRLNAERIEQPRPESDILVTEPRVVYDPAVGSPWTLRAERGLLPPDARRAQLTGKVELNGTPKDWSAPLTVRTEALDLDITAQQATTAERVQIESGSTRITGRGLFADMKGSSLQLKSDVHGQSAP